MKNNAVAFAGIGVLIVIGFAALGIIGIQFVAAQVDATSTETIAASSEPVTPGEAITDTTTNTETAAPATDGASGEVSAAPSDVTSPTESSSVAPTEPPPQGLTEVHIIGTKYVDYFTDGTTVTAYPGDPEIAAHFDEKDAPIPTHEGLTWVHTTGGYLYDTSSGDLEVGQYAVQPNGTYITNAPPFVSSTSTPAVLGDSTSASDIPSDTSTTTPVPTDTTAPTTTSADSTTAPVTNDGASDASEPSPTATTTDTPSS